MNAATVPAAAELPRLTVALDQAAAIADQAAAVAYAYGRADGFREGHAATEADMAASWRALTEPIVNPERGTERRQRAAEAGQRRDAAEHERAFVSRAYATPDHLRTDVQRATVLLYPPPDRRGAA